MVYNLSTLQQAQTLRMNKKEEQTRAIDELKRLTETKRRALEERRNRASNTPITPRTPRTPISEATQPSQGSHLFINTLKTSLTTPVTPHQSTPVESPLNLHEQQSVTTPNSALSTISTEEVTRELIQKRKLGLTLVRQEEMVVDFPPRVTYEKVIQTDESSVIKQEVEVVAKPQKSVIEEVDDIDFLAEQEKIAKHEKSEEEIQSNIEEQVKSLGFSNFFNKASLLVERCLNQPFDPLINYEQDSSLDNKETDYERVQFENVFYEDKSCKGRSVTSIAWSKKHEELFLGTYFSNEDGLVLQWSLYLPDRPEKKFECETPVSTATFFKYNPNLIIGGTYSGQILVWDAREKSTPVQRSSISARSHTQPIFGLEVIGSESLDQIITMSTDGKLCTWNLEKLNAPSEIVELYVRQENSDKDVMTYSLSFPYGETNKFFVGSENGNMYSAYLLGSKSGISETYTGHFAPITGTDFHPTREFSDLAVTSSMDWSCKLWSHKYKRCLYSFEEYEDYVYDVRWSPVHPALFGSVDGKGKLALWNLNKDIDVPVYSHTVCDNALNRLRWSNNGKRIACGSVTGQIYMYKLEDDLAAPKLMDDEYKKLKKVRQELVTLSSAGDVNDLMSENVD